MATSINNSAWLQWIAGLMGGASRQTYAAALPPDRFYCLLDELPLHLIPRAARRSLRNDFCDQPLYRNPECTIGAAEQIPQELVAHEDLLSGFALQGTIAWVRNEASGSLLPFWLGPESESLLRTIRPGEPVPMTTPVSLRQLLTAAGILIPANGQEQQYMTRDALRQNASVLFRERGYAPLSGLIHPFHVAALRRYYRHRIRSGAIYLGDGQSDRRYVAHNEPVTRFFHRQIAAAFSAVAGEPLTPSYVYLASYLPGAVLKKHTDREQCDFSITFCLDFSPEPALATPWPIRLDAPTGTVTVYQALGDGLAYRGTRLPHYRGVLGAGQTSTSIFFHYVGADFDGPLK